MILAIAAGVMSCSSLEPSEAELPAGAIALSSPSIYHEWHERTQSCSGLAGDFSTVQFYVVPGVDTFPTEAGPKVGMWARVGRVNRIVLAGNYVAHEMVVRHEMLHALLQREGHPSNFFVERCRLTWDSWSLASAD